MTIAIIITIHLIQDRVPVAGSCEYGNVLSDSIKCREFLYYLRGYLLLKNDPSS
jgi:hypothetical protein